jgi:hypothetical protein
MSLSGEEIHALGDEGVKRAKIWLDRTTRADARWTTPDRVAVKKLTFPWGDKTTFSFDLGGILLGDEVDGEIFVAESKYYSGASDQGTHYEKYVAKCYCAYIASPARCDHFMWITWHPFNVTRWREMLSPEYVREAVLKHRARTLGVTEEAEAEKLISQAAVAKTAERLWLIVLSQRQETTLMMSKEHLGLIKQHEAAS